MANTYIEIGLCDDQPHSVNKFENDIAGYMEKHGYEYHIHRFSMPSDVYTYLENAPIHILFMDLEFGDRTEDGVLWIRRIHEKHPEVLNIILTAYEDRYKEGYRVRAYRFMTKPPLDRELEENMQDCLRELISRQTIEIKQRQLNIPVKLQDITYIEAYTGGSAIHATDRDYYREESLLQWEKQLDDRLFFRIHKSYIINISHVTDVYPSKHEVALGADIRLPISRRNWTAFMKAYTEYDVRGRT